MGKVFREGFMRPKNDPKVQKAITQVYKLMSGPNIAKGQPVRLKVVSYNNYRLLSPSLTLTAIMNTSISPDATNNRSGLCVRHVKSYVDPNNGDDVIVLMAVRHRATSASANRLEASPVIVRNGVMQGLGFFALVDDSASSSTDSVALTVVSDYRFLVMFYRSGSIRFLAFETSTTWGTLSSVGAEYTPPLSIISIFSAPLKVGTDMFVVFGQSSSKPNILALSVSGNVVAFGTPVELTTDAVGQGSAMAASDGSMSGYLTYFKASYNSYYRSFTVSSSRVITLGTETYFNVNRYLVPIFTLGRYYLLDISSSSGSDYLYKIHEVTLGSTISLRLLFTASSYDESIGLPSLDSFLDIWENPKMGLSIISLINQRLFLVIDRGSYVLTSVNSYNSGDGTAFKILPVSPFQCVGYCHNLSGGLRCDYSLYYMDRDLFGIALENGVDTQYIKVKRVSSY